jgi:hypothetical protein
MTTQALIYEELVEQKCWRSTAKGISDLFFHSRNVYVLLSGLHRAGVYAGLDSTA